MSIRPILIEPSRAPGMLRHLTSTLEHPLMWRRADPAGGVLAWVPSRLIPSRVGQLAAIWRRTITALLWGDSVAFACITLRDAWDARLIVPFWDEWDLLTVHRYITQSGDVFAELWTPYNGHYEPIPRLLFLARDLLLGGDAIALIAACLVLQGALIGIIVAAFLREPDLRGSVLQHVLIAAARATVPLRAALARGRTQHGADDGADAADRYASVCLSVPASALHPRRSQGIAGGAINRTRRLRGGAWNRARREKPVGRPGGGACCVWSECRAAHGHGPSGDRRSCIQPNMAFSSLYWVGLLAFGGSLAPVREWGVARWAIHGALLSGLEPAMTIQTVADEPFVQRADRATAAVLSIV